MIKVLRGLFGENPREHPVKKPTPIAIAKRSNRWFAGPESRKRGGRRSAAK
jgi:hypothetical protein